MTTTTTTTTTTPDATVWSVTRQTSASESCWEYVRDEDEDEVDDYTAQVYKMAGTENELLNHIRSRKLRYFGHVMRQPHDNVEGCVQCEVSSEWETVEDNEYIMLVGQHLPVDWSIGVIHTVRDKKCWTSLTHPCSQPLRSDDGEMTRWHDRNSALYCTQCVQGSPARNALRAALYAATFKCKDGGCPEYLAFVQQWEKRDCWERWSDNFWWLRMAKNGKN